MNGREAVGLVAVAWTNGQGLKGWRILPGPRVTCVTGWSPS